MPRFGESIEYPPPSPNSDLRHDDIRELFGHPGPCVGESVAFDFEDHVQRLVQGECEKMKDEIRINMKAELKSELTAELLEQFHASSAVPRPTTYGQASDSDRRSEDGSGDTGNIRQLESQPTPCATFGSFFDSASKDMDALPILDLTADSLLAQDMNYVFYDTVWDLMTFCGLGVTAKLDQMIIAMIVLFNVVVQSIFIWLLMSMIEVDFDKFVSELLDWRILYAHSPDFADPITSTPLAESVCEGSVFMMQGARQASIAAWIDEYTSPFLGFPRGGALCVLAEFLWLLTCARECRKMLTFLIGIWTPHTPQMSFLFGTGIHQSYVRVVDKPVLWMFGEECQKNYQIIIAPRRALTLTLVVFLPRLAILVTLALAGSLYLIQTDDLEELILNCVALEVVLNVDEMIFDIFAPPSARRMVHKTLPLRIPRCKWALSCISVLNMIIVASALSLVGLTCLGPKLERLKEAMTVMCGGDQSFLAAQMQHGPVVVGAPNISTTQRDSYTYLAIHHRTGLQNQATHLLGEGLYFEGGEFHFSSLRTLKAWSDQTLAEVASLPLSNPRSKLCEDPEITDARHVEVIFAGAASKIGNSSVRSCADVEQYCFNDAGQNGKLARFICPFTCGGRNPSLGLFLNSAIDGLPTQCEQSFSIQLEDKACQDKDKSDRKSKTWRNYVAGVVAHMDNFFRQISTDPSTNLLNQTVYLQLRNKLSDGFAKKGCQFFEKPIKYRQPARTHFKSRLHIFDFCDTEAGLGGRRSVRWMCPQTCGCDTTWKRHYAALLNSSQFGFGSSTLLTALQCPQSCFQ